MKARFRFFLLILFIGLMGFFLIFSRLQKQDPQWDVVSLVSASPFHSALNSSPSSPQPLDSLISLSVSSSASSTISSSRDHSVSTTSISVSKSFSPSASFSRVASPTTSYPMLVSATTSNSVRQSASLQDLPLFYDHSIEFPDSISGKAVQCSQFQIRISSRHFISSDWQHLLVEISVGGQKLIYPLQPKGFL